MAVLRNLVLAAALLTPFALAAPLLDERAIYTYTYTEIAWVTVEETTTVWVEPTTPTPAPVAPVSSSTTSSVAPAVFAQTTYSPSTIATVAAAPSAAAWSSSSAPLPSSAPASAAPGPAGMNVQPKDISASASNDCDDENDACVGDVTHWDGGVGACGWNVDTDSDYQIALPYAFMGTESNNNPYCGRAVTLYNPNSGTTVSVTVGDKCMGCENRAVDCTDVVFNAITDGEGNGRYSGIEWWFT